MAVWWLATSENDKNCSYAELKQRKILAQGWDIGDLTNLIAQYPDKNVLQNALQPLINNNYPKNNQKNGDYRAKSIVNLLRMEAGDIVAVCEGIEVKGLAKITEPLTYSYDSNYEYANQVCVVSDWKDWDSSKVGIDRKSVV